MQKLLNYVGNYYQGWNLQTGWSTAKQLCAVILLPCVWSFGTELVFGLILLPRSGNPSCNFMRQQFQDQTLIVSSVPV